MCESCTSNIHHSKFTSNYCFTTQSIKSVSINPDSQIINLSNGGIKFISRYDTLNITDLDLSKNQLQSRDITLFPNKIKVLNLSENRLETIPSEIWQLSHLEILFISINQLTTLNLSSSIKATLLTNLDISNNKIKHLFSDMCILTNLKYLNIMNNSEIEMLPAGFHFCFKLTIEEFYKLSNLIDLKCNNEEFFSLPPPVIMKEGTFAIISYLKELALGSVKNEHVKVVTIGDAGAGKVFIYILFCIYYNT